MSLQQQGTEVIKINCCLTIIENLCEGELAITKTLQFAAAGAATYIIPRQTGV